MQGTSKRIQRRSGGMAVEPFGGLAYVNYDTENFRERGGALASLRGIDVDQDVGLLDSEPARRSHDAVRRHANRAAPLRRVAARLRRRDAGRGTGRRGHRHRLRDQPRQAFRTPANSATASRQWRQRPPHLAILSNWQCPLRGHKA